MLISEQTAIIFPYSVNWLVFYNWDSVFTARYGLRVCLEMVEFYAVFWFKLWDWFWSRYCNGLLAEMSDIVLHFVKIGAVQMEGLETYSHKKKTVSRDSLSLFLPMCVTLI